MIFEADMEKTFWGKAVYVSTYLMNRNASQSIDKTPIELWNGNLHIFETNSNK